MANDTTLARVTPTFGRGRKKLETWIHERLIDTEESNEKSAGPCTAMALEHMVGTTPQPICSRRFGSQPVDPRDLALYFQDAAETHSQDMPGVQTYRLLAFYNNSSQASTFQPFTVAGKQDFDGLMTEAPDGKGLTAQAMRHTEVMTQTALRTVTALQEATVQTMQVIAGQNAKLIEENHALLMGFRNMLLDQTNVAHEHQMQALQYQRNSKIQEKVVGYVPAIVNTLTGREVFPQSTADTALIETIANSISTEQAEQLATILPPELLGPVMARMGQILKEKRLGDEEQRRLVAARDPEADARGD
jgi:hypothetical protein